MIKIRDDKHRMYLYDNAFPMSRNCVDWCKKIPEEGVTCSRPKGHSGPHRYKAEILWLWYDEGREEEERVLEMCVRLGVKLPEAAER